MKPSILRGKLSGIYLAEALQLILRSPEEGWIFVVRCIDSTRDSLGVSKILSFHKVNHDTLNSNVFLTLKDLKDFPLDQLFAGFDEVWVFIDSPPHKNLNGLPTATSETTDFSEAFPRELNKAFEQHGCLLILGDGCGLNFATTSKKIAQSLTQLSQT
ncbi:MAG: hypothetical protein DWQ01_07610 [Planctomycetota bacterium]|nr:MAG: hypothetical protein DWQ01_07610 [Planctomycetota bacterium]